ncbi:hypothetical protein [Actinomycetospora sp. NBRC 106378]|uniref:hypothetical protein n=1 Tax=Actinomycetospora sp. NBRC 106378 TaxID=3032208 RepID=UPI0025524F26|nr:hypothetical protein [Actinomycetospora sp. NBRC 106378]
MEAARPGRSTRCSTRTGSRWPTCSSAGEPAWDATARLAADLAPVFGTAVDVVDLEPATLVLRGLVADRGRLLQSTDEARRVRFEVDARMASATEALQDVLDATRPVPSPLNSTGAAPAGHASRWLRQTRREEACEG